MNTGNTGTSRRKDIGFLSFGHWGGGRASAVRNASDALLQSIELTVAAEEIGVDGAYFRVHHFGHQLSSPFPLLAAAAARTSKIHLGTGVIDMRYENPLYMAETAGATDVISGGRLQLGISRGAPEPIKGGWLQYGQLSDAGKSDIELARDHSEMLLKVLAGASFAPPAGPQRFPAPPGPLRLEPYAEGLRERVWWGSASPSTASWAAKLGMNLQSSTLLEDENGKPFHVQQREQIEAYRAAWAAAGHARAPRVSVTRSIFALVDDRDFAYFGHSGDTEDQISRFDENTRVIFGRGYAAEPEVLVKQLAQDEAIAAADTLLLAIPSQLGVDYNIHVLEAILKHVAPALGWR